MARENRINFPNRLYPIFDPQPYVNNHISHMSDLLTFLEELFLSGTRIVQVRSKNMLDYDFFQCLKRIREVSTHHQVQLIVNDRFDLAMACGADGVHLGQDDLPPEIVRQQVPPNFIIGFSTHNLQQVRAAAKMPVDYLGFGPVFPTSSKDNPDPTTGLEALAEAIKISTQKVVAIGGISKHNIEEVIKSGASAAAVLSAVQRQCHPGQALRELIKAIEES